MFRLTEYMQPARQTDTGAQTPSRPGEAGSDLEPDAALQSEMPPLLHRFSRCRVPR